MHTVTLFSETVIEIYFIKNILQFSNDIYDKRNNLCSFLIILKPGMCSTSHGPLCMYQYFMLFLILFINSLLKQTNIVYNFISVHMYFFLPSR